MKSRTQLSVSHARRSSSKRATVMKNQPSDNQLRRSERTPQKEKQSISKATMNKTTTTKKETQNKTSTMLRKGKTIFVRESNGLSKNLFPTKTKGIIKKDKSNNSQEYQQFYKYHFEKLKDQHPNWSNKEITSISSLLWKKYKKSLKKPQEGLDIEESYEKLLNGKESFMKSQLKKGSSAKSAEEMWKRLPVEAKRKWGANIKEPLLKNQQQAMKLGMGKQEELNPFGFLNKS